MRSIASREVILPASTCLPVTDEQGTDLCDLSVKKQMSNRWFDYF